MSALCRAANVAWLATAMPAWRAYRSALRSPRRAQVRRLRQLLRENAETELGRERNFGSILGGSSGRTQPDEALVERYRRAVPVCTYEDYRDFVDRTRAGHARLLTNEPIERLVPTGGSSSGPKLIPFTRALRREFSAAVNPWIAALALATPRVLGGPAYWSITPAAGEDRTGAVPIGFDRDSEYLGGAGRRLAHAVLAAPDELGQVRDPVSFRYLTLLFLVRAGDLRLISVWHPSFLTGLLDDLPALLPELATDVSRGALSPPGPVKDEVLRRLAARVRPDRRRADELRAADATCPRSVWPALSLVSCWGDAGAEAAAAALRSRVPGVDVQIKGLLATEGVVSLPFGPAHPVAVTSHFVEFLDPGGTPHLADELQPGGEYTVVLTTGGGLYRYRLGDRVRVNGFVARTPSLRFVGRDDAVSDVCGEKLTDAFVARAIRRLFERHRPAFVMLAPERLGSGTAYTLFVDSAADHTDLGTRLERELRHNPQYAWSVDMRQLHPARVVPVGPAAERVFVEACVARGQRLGDVKVPSLHPETGWSERFSRGAAAVQPKARGAR